MTGAKPICNNCHISHVRYRKFIVALIKTYPHTTSFSFFVFVISVNICMRRMQTESKVEQGL